MRGLLVAGLAAGLAAAVVGTAILASAASLLGVGGGTPMSPASTAQIPPAMLALYQQAAATCPGLSWTILAAIGTIESDNGQSDLPGVHSGANAAGAVGIMQFEPSTFAAYDQPVPPGGVNPPSPYDPTDAVFAAARLLCADGAAEGADLSGAVYAYNHSASYVAEVLALAQTYASSPATTAETESSDSAGAVALSWALSQIGTPYVWGGETPGVGFDCSGLVQAAYAVAGVSLPRVAQDQYNATPKLAAGSVLAPGDLVFFGGSPDSIDHVGLFVGVVRWTERHGRCAVHGRRRAGRGLPGDGGCSVRQPALRRSDAASVTGDRSRPA